KATEAIAREELHRSRASRLLQRLWMLHVGRGEDLGRLALRDALAQKPRGAVDRLDLRLGECARDLVERRSEAARGVEPYRFLRMDVHRGQDAGEKREALHFFAFGKKSCSPLIL